MSALRDLMLARPGLTLAAAESATCGRLQAAIGAITGASAFFSGGMTAYTLEQKVRHLGVNRAEARAVSCVSAGVAEQMARGACRLFGASLGVATTGYAEPPRKGVAPFVWWAVAHRTAGGRCAVRSGRAAFPGAGRTRVQELAAAAALAALEEFIAGLPPAKRSRPVRARSG